MKRFKVTLADKRIFHAHRNSYDVFTEGWSFEGMGSIMFRMDSIDVENIDKDGNITRQNIQKHGEKVRIQKHWIITIEEE